MKKFIVFILFILSAGLCYMATRPSHTPPHSTTYPAGSTTKAETTTKGTNSITQKLPSLPSVAQGKTGIMASLPKPVKIFTQAYYLKDVTEEKTGKGNWVDLQNMPKAMPQALIAIEDRRFYEHHGVDMDGIIRAILVNIQADSVVEGASTLTQQLVKNNLLTDEQSVERKILEAGLALMVESRYSKDEILEMYLNTTYFGAGATGLKAASATYFGVKPKDLSLAECATIAALPYAPSALNPKENPKGCKERRNLVLTQMSKNGFISQNEMTKAQAAPLEVE
jgi:membrane peptidoglycan carboxypeptidase